MLIGEDGQLVPHRRHHYFFQVQGQLNITRRQFCHLVMFTDHDMEVIEIEREEAFWANEMVPKLTQFYLHCVLPEIVDSRHARDMRVREPEYILAAQKQLAERNAAKAAKAPRKQIAAGAGAPKKRRLVESAGPSRMN